MNRREFLCSVAAAAVATPLVPVLIDGARAAPGAQVTEWYSTTFVDPSKLTPALFDDILRDTQRSFERAGERNGFDPKRALSRHVEAKYDPERDVLLISECITTERVRIF